MDEKKINREKNIYRRGHTPLLLCVAAGFLAIGLIGGLAAGYFWLFQGKGLQAFPLRQGRNEYKFINPLLACEISPPADSREFQPLKDSINAAIDREKKAGKAEMVSVYYRDLLSGHWVSINDTEKYYPASLFKVLVTIAFYKMAENRPEILTQKFTYNDDGSETVPQNILPSKMLQKGQTYTAEELIEYLIVYSDNRPSKLLGEVLKPDELQEIYDDLSINTKEIKIDQDFMTARSYAFLMRILYSATYLTRADSEKVLELLSRTQFADGLVAGVPAEVAVAHKFGEHALNYGNFLGGEEFHDCGIVYAPDHPYLLCVMTKGKDFKGLKETIKDISKTVYEGREAK